MAETTIAWTDYTFNPWRGCTKVSEGCRNCYAERQSKRNPKVLSVWGPEGTRVVASESAWREPIKWNAEAVRDGVRRRVFCASMADVFEDWQESMTCYRTGETLSVNASGHVWPIGWPSLSDGDDWGVRDYTMDDARKRLFSMIAATPYLDWQLLTKRPENILATLERLRDMNTVALDSWPWPNVWIGTSVENQQTADERIPHLLQVPAAVRFLSCEPLLGRVILHKYLASCQCGHGHGFTACPNTGGVSAVCHVLGCSCPRLRPLVSWVIAGGESGPKSRPCEVDWVRSVVRQCKAARVPVFVKQLGAQPVPSPDDPIGSLQGFGAIADTARAMGKAIGVELPRWEPKGGDAEQWPADLRVREFPEVTP